jgi:hypothetical protein
VINPDSLNFEVKSHPILPVWRNVLTSLFLVWCRLREDQATCPSLV